MMDILRDGVLIKYITVFFIFLLKLRLTNGFKEIQKLKARRGTVRLFNWCFLFKFLLTLFIVFHAGTKTFFFLDLN